MKTKTMYAVVPYYGKADEEAEDTYYWYFYESKKEAVEQAEKLIYRDDYYARCDIVKWDDELQDVIGKKPIVTIEK